MQDHEYGKATRWFIQAFANAKQAIAGKQEEKLLRDPELAFAANFRSAGSTGGQKDVVSSSDTTYNATTPSHPPSMNPGNTPIISDEADEDSASCIFRVPMSTSEVHASDETKFAMGICVVAIYNFGVLCLLAPSSSSSERTNPSCTIARQRKGKFLRAAVNLLELAVGLAQSSRVQIGFIFEMAMANNLGHVHRMLGDEHRADQSFRYLLSAVLLLHDHSKRRKSQPGQLIIPEEFFRSVSYLLLFDVGAAAA